MKKKRFIKLLMGAGFSRNTATVAAKAAAVSQVPKTDILLNILDVRDACIGNPMFAHLIEPSLLKVAKNIIAEGGAENA